MATFGSSGIFPSPAPTLQQRVDQLERRLRHLQTKKALETRVSDLERQIAELEAA